MPSPVVLPMLFMYSTTGLAIRRAIAVLSRFRAGEIEPAALPFHSVVYRAARQSGLRAHSARGLRVVSHQAGPQRANETSAKAR